MDKAPRSSAGFISSAGLVPAHTKDNMSERMVTSEKMLGVAFTFLIALLIGGAYLGLSRMDQISTNLNKVLGVQWTTLSLSRQALAYSSRNSRITIEIFLLKDTQGLDPLMKRRAENTEKIAELIKQIESLCDSQEDVQLLTAVREARAPYVASYTRALHLLLKEHKRDAASTLMLQETTPAMFKYHATWDSFMQAQIEQVDKAASESMARNSSTRAFVMLLTALAVFLATSIAVIATRKIGREMRTRVIAEREVRELNATLEQRVEERTRELFQANQQLTNEVEVRKAAQEQSHSLAYYDVLTGLANRILFQDRLAKALASARRRKEKVAVLFLDLDRFKTINDSLGHAVGDLVLQEAAERLTKWVREQDTLARLGGDEFVLILTDVEDAANAAVAADRFMQAISTEFLVQGHSLSMGCSIGISMFPDDGMDLETLVKNADAAMYCAKDNGRNNFQFFTSEMNARAVERLKLENSLRVALQRKEFFLEYQPQLDIATGTIIGAEALLRWRHPELGLIPPAKFIPIAENNGTIIPIGEWALRTACIQARQWHEQGIGPLPVAVNVSTVQFRQDRFLQVVRNVLEETGLPPQFLELELTESLLLSTAEVTISMMEQLKDMGVRLSIDDFGTGYSNLSYLRHLPVYKLKIDRSFVQAMTVDADDAAITDTIIKMAKTLNLKVIAEGVETEQQMQFLRSHDCDEIQGYHFSRPLGACEFADKARLSNFSYTNAIGESGKTAAALGGQSHPRSILPVCRQLAIENKRLSSSRVVSRQERDSKC